MVHSVRNSDQSGGGEGQIFDTLSEGLKEEAAKVVLGHLYPFLGRIKEGFARKKQRDIAYFLAELARRAEDEGADFQNEFMEECLGEEGTSEVITQALKAALEITDSRILAALAHLAFHYQSNSKPVDLFFRGLVRLLESIGTAEFNVIQTLLDAATKLINAKPDNPMQLLRIWRKAEMGVTQVELYPGYMWGADVDFTPALKNLLISTGLGDTPHPPLTTSEASNFGHEPDLDWSVGIVGELARFFLDPPRGSLSASK
jgi:hypothetical protein